MDTLEKYYSVIMIKIYPTSFMYGTWKCIKSAITVVIRHFCKIIRTGNRERHNRKVGAERNVIFLR